MNHHESNTGHEDQELYGRAMELRRHIDDLLNYLEVTGRNDD